ncbi:hypothetical protein OZD70_04820 [Wolbachia endosymbiont of Drosophila tsacasi]|uniref:Agmatine deiminase family protein n=1 Tax=Wolbachia pipientis TaxID=955 RepID=A0A7G5CBQ2_WOLPI|nr:MULTISPECIES: hypothetical protein [Wolbachia]MDE5061486.1 hypothetical protein [Wolbachia endosymbiont of Drosophila nikananu]MDE5062560.1 hypothetical protein [Wolbachia endosymbiont of Drosophila tsacasi]QMV46636.1 agmatine deiminase family protein [Wolbachia pipientis]
MCIIQHFRSKAGFQPGMTGEGCWDNKERNTGMTKIGTETIEKEHYGIWLQRLILLNIT